MDGRTIYCFLFFAVAVGMVTLSRGDPHPPYSTQRANTTDTVFQYTTPAVKLNETSPAESTPKFSTPTAPRQAPCSTAGAPVCPPVVPCEKSKVCNEERAANKTQKFLFLVILGGLLFLCVILLVTTVTLACKVCCLKGRQKDRSPAHANGRGPFGSSREDAEGGEVAGMGAAETSVMLEEVKPVKDEEETTTREEAGKGEGDSGKGEASPAEEAESGPTATPALEPAPAAGPEPDKSPTPQTTPTPTSEPASDKA